MIVGRRFLGWLVAAEVRKNTEAVVFIFEKFARSVFRVWSEMLGDKILIREKLFQMLTNLFKAVATWLGRQ